MVKTKSKKTELQLLIEINNKLDNIEHLQKSEKNTSHFIFSLAKCSLTFVLGIDTLLTSLKLNLVHNPIGITISSMIAVLGIFITQILDISHYKIKNVEIEENFVTTLIYFLVFFSITFLAFSVMKFGPNHSNDNPLNYYPSHAYVGY